MVLVISFVFFVKNIESKIFMMHQLGWTILLHFEICIDLRLFAKSTFF